MIVIKPKFNAVFSLAIFIFILLALAVFMGYQYYYSKNPEPYQFFILVFTGAFGLALLVKFLWNWKTIQIGKGKFSIRYNFRFRQMTTNGKEMIFWKEETIKTWGGTYSEIDIHFEPKFKINVSLQEHEGYMKLRKYLEKNYAKLKRNF